MYDLQIEFQNSLCAGPDRTLKLEMWGFQGYFVMRLGAEDGARVGELQVQSKAASGLPLLNELGQQYSVNSRATERYHALTVACPC